MMNSVQVQYDLLRIAEKSNQTDRVVIDRAITLLSYLDRVLDISSVIETELKDYDYTVRGNTDL